MTDSSVSIASWDSSVSLSIVFCKNSSKRLVTSGSLKSYENEKIKRRKKEKRFVKIILIK